MEGAIQQRYALDHWTGEHWTVFLFVWSLSSHWLENLRRHHYLWRAANFDLWSALMAIEQWGFFSVPHLLWHGVSIYNGHLRGPVTLTPIAERLAEELSLPVFATRVCRCWDSNTNLPLAGRHHRGPLDSGKINYGDTQHEEIKHWFVDK